MYNIFYCKIWERDTVLKRRTGYIVRMRRRRTTESDHHQSGLGAVPKLRMDKYPYDMVYTVYLYYLGFPLKWSENPVLFFFLKFLLWRHSSFVRRVM